MQSREDFVLRSYVSTDSMDFPDDWKPVRLDKGWWCKCCWCKVGPGDELQVHLGTTKHKRWENHSKRYLDLVERAESGLLPDWIRVKNFGEWCTLCEAPASGQHTTSRRHKWLQQQWEEARSRPIRPAPTAADAVELTSIQLRSVPGDLAVTSASAGTWFCPSQSSDSLGLPDYLLQDGGQARFYEWKAQHWKWYCKLCDKFAEQAHVDSAMHRKRATWPDSYLLVDNPPSGFTLQSSSAPPLPPSESPPPALQFSSAPPPPPSEPPPPDVEQMELPVGWYVSFENLPGWQAGPFYYNMIDSRGGPEPNAEPIWEKPPMLPSGWRCRFSKPHNKFYFFQVADDGSFLGGQTWDLPPQTVPGPPDRPPAVAPPPTVPVAAAWEVVPANESELAPLPESTSPTAAMPFDGTNRPALDSEESRPATRETHVSFSFGMPSAGRGLHMVMPNFASRQRSLRETRSTT